jgi:competence protein ComEC
MPAGVVAQQVSGASKFTIDAWKHYWAVEDFRPLPAGGDEDGWSCTAEACRLQPLPRRKGVLLVRGATHPDGCRESSVIVSAEPARGLCPRPWPALVDRFTVWRNGATAIWLNGKRAVVLTDRAWRGDRPWVPPIPTPHAKTAPLLAPAPRDTAPAGPAID